MVSPGSLLKPSESWDQFLSLTVVRSEYIFCKLKGKL